MGDRGHGQGSRAELELGRARPCPQTSSRTTPGTVPRPGESLFEETHWQCGRGPQCCRSPGLARAGVSSGLGGRPLASRGYGAGTFDLQATAGGVSYMVRTETGWLAREGILRAGV